MKRGKRRAPASVRTRSHQTLLYPWATSVSIDRRGDLRIWQGLHQRAFHPAGEWLSYTVEAPETASEWFNGKNLQLSEMNPQPEA